MSSSRDVCQPCVAGTCLPLQILNTVTAHALGLPAVGLALTGRSETQTAALSSELSDNAPVSLEYPPNLTLSSSFSFPQSPPCYSQLQLSAGGHRKGGHTHSCEWLLSSFFYRHCCGLILKCSLKDYMLNAWSAVCALR